MIQRRNINLKDFPNYTLGDAARYLRLPASTIRAWTYGQNYPVKGGHHFFGPIIEPADSKNKLLSFTNLTELHVLSSARREYAVRLAKIRISIENLKLITGSTRPLAEIDLHTDKEDLFIELFGEFVSASTGQISVRNVVEGYLERIERDTHGSPLKLFPIYRTLKEQLIQPKVIEINPGLAFGRPVVTGTRIPSKVIADRFGAGEKIASIANDYDLSTGIVEDVIRCETQSEAA